MALHRRPFKPDGSGAQVPLPLHALEMQHSQNVLGLRVLPAGGSTEQGGRAFPIAESLAGREDRSWPAGKVPRRSLPKPIFRRLRNAVPKSPRSSASMPSSGGPAATRLANNTAKRSPPRMPTAAIRCPITVSSCPIRSPEPHPPRCLRVVSLRPNTSAGCPMARLTDRVRRTKAVARAARVSAVRRGGFIHNKLPLLGTGRKHRPTLAHTRPRMPGFTTGCGPPARRRAAWRGHGRETE